jgi:hypothetical protein
MQNTICAKLRYRWGGREGVGFVELKGAAAQHHQGLLVLDDPDNAPIPWFEARMADIEIIEIDAVSRELLHHAGYRLQGL